MKFVNISIGTIDSFLMNEAVKLVRSEGFDVDYHNYDNVDLDEDPLFLAEAVKIISEADFVTMKVHGDTTYCKKFDKLRDAIEQHNVCMHLSCTDACVTEAFRSYFHGTDEEYDLIMSYAVFGGDENFVSLIKWAIRKYDGIDLEIPEPVHPLTEGVYYPGSDDHDISRYLDSLDGSKPNIGIFFYQKQWVTGNLESIDGLIRAVEKLGGNPVPIFLNTAEEKIDHSKGVKRLLREDLTRNGKPVLDAIIETMSFSQTLIATPGVGDQIIDDNFFLDYGVPALQSMTMVSDESTWRERLEGLSPAEIAYDVVHPEFDGQIITVPCASNEYKDGGIRYYHSIDDRAMRVADMAIMWAKLRHIENKDRKVAILLYQYPPKNADAGGAAGLDTFASVVNILHRMKDDGYDVGNIPETPRELVEILLAGLTNDTEWISDDEVRKRAEDLIPPEQYDIWYKELSDRVRERIEKDWDKPPGKFYTVGKDIIATGTVFGNIIVGFQPDRGRDIQANYHDPNCVHPHQYYAYYKWLREDFGANAVIHVGTHGTLEWLPGKSIALSGDCCPDYILTSLPDIYPYVIGNPGEGIQAKRRAAAVIIDHMIPTMTRSGGYDEILELEGTVQNYMNSMAQGQDQNCLLILSKLREILLRMDMYSDLKLDPNCSDDELREKIDDLYDYVVDIKENLIKDGLHILGEIPEGKRLEEDVYSLVRMANGEIPSLRVAIASSMGYELMELQNNSSGRDPKTGRLNGEILEEVEVRMESLISEIAAAGFEREACLKLTEDFENDDDIRKTVAFVCDELYPNLMRMDNEIDSVMSALRGNFIEPGPSGCPTRGRAQILPTGRNFYSIDPDAIPWHSSWEIGKKMADQMLERFVDEHGSYPKNIGIVMWATDTMKTGGDDTAYVLWLLGIRPVWTGYAGRVKDLEVIPVSELGRPRIDVTLRISGLFRDTFPNLVRLIDRAVRMIADLDETEEENYILANLRHDIVLSIEEGMPEDQAREDAMIRIFGDAPGSYGSGTNILVRTSDWKDRGEIGKIYRDYGEYAYGIGRSGERKPDAFRHKLMNMDVTVKNSVSREYDMFDNDDVYTDLGGFNAAVESVRGEKPMSVIGFSADTSNIKTKTIDEEGRYIFRSKINNPKWVEGLKPHGFKGAQEISKMTEYVFGWDATSDIIEGWEYKSIADNFLFNKDNADWFRDANPYAMYEVTARLLEAIYRGMWDADEETEEKLKELFEDLEGDIEGLNDR